LGHDGPILQLHTRGACGEAATGSIPQKGEANDGMFKVVVGRTGTMQGMNVGKDMGPNTWAAFAGSDDKAVIDGEFAMPENEPQPVLKSMRADGIISWPYTAAPYRCSRARSDGLARVIFTRIPSSTQRAHQSYGRLVLCSTHVQCFAPIPQLAALRVEQLQLAHEPVAVADVRQYGCTSG
jgi:hypothetical protein